MTLNVMLVGKFYNKISDSIDANADFHKNDDQDDPNILPLNQNHEVGLLYNLHYRTYRKLLSKKKAK